MLKLTAMLLGVAALSQAEAARTLLDSQNCGGLGQEWCNESTCNDDLLPVNLGGESTICRKPEEAAASGGIVGGSGGSDIVDEPDEDDESEEESDSQVCGGLGQEVCAGDSCEDDLVPVNLGGMKTICRKPEEAAAAAAQESGAASEEEEPDMPEEEPEIPEEEPEMPEEEPDMPEEEPDVPSSTPSSTPSSIPSPTPSPSSTPTSLSEPMPAPSDPTPSESEPTPSESEPSPSSTPTSLSEPMPAPSEPTPSESEPMPSPSETPAPEPTPSPLAQFIAAASDPAPEPEADEPAPEPETEEATPSGSCGGGGQPVCTGDDLAGRTFECDFGFVGDNGICVPFEENITSTPVAPETTGDDTTGDETTPETPTEEEAPTETETPTTDTSAPPPTEEQTPIEPPSGDFEFEGELTYYGGAGAGGACSSSFVPPGFTTVALNAPQYNAQNECGTCVFACFTDNSGERCFEAIIDNLCPECAFGDLDLGESGDGRWPVSWQKITCPSSGPLQFTLQGSNASFAKVKAEGGPASVTAMTCNGMQGIGTPDGFFEFNDTVNQDLDQGLDCTVTFSDGSTDSQTGIF